MKRTLSLVVIGAALAAGGCGGAGDGTLESCSGTFTGTFSGDESGLLTATLRFSGQFDVTFVAEGEEDELVSATVTSTGAISSPASGRRLSGDLDLQECSASGQWMSASRSGDWSVRKR